jgi:hypothetical protein
MTFPDTSLPIHPRTGLRAVGIVRGRPVWPILGGDGTGDAGSATGQQTATGTDAGTGAVGTQTGQQTAGTGTATDTGTQTGTNNGDGGTGQQQAGQGTPPKPGPPAQKTFTQAELDSIIQKRMSGFEESFSKKLAGLFGGEPAGDGAPKPEAVLKQAQDAIDSTRQQAHLTMAETLAEKAGIKPERLDVFLGLANLKGALKDVDQNDPAAVKAAIKTAVEAKATEYPEWKSEQLPGASGGDRGQHAADGKKRWTRDEISKLSQEDLVKNAAELQKAAAEGRIS